MFGGGSTVVYAAGAERDGTLQHVFVERDRDGKLEVALAQRATHAYSADGDMQVITLYDGERFEGIPGERKFRIVRFAENTIPVRLPAAASGAVKLSGASLTALLSTRGREELAELHWRIFFPLMALVLAGIGIPLAKLQPRQGRYARMGYAVLIFFVYISLAIAGQKALARGAIPSWFGLWWAHAAVILLAALILLMPRWRARLRHRRAMRRALPAAVPA
jgi:lipopolysaccharide export system permease protein